MDQAAAAHPSKPASEPVPGPDSPSFPVVGIGASAGGLKAVGLLLAEIPPDTGMAFVVVQHLDPTHESLLTELLARTSALPVAEAADGCLVRPNHVYVITPNTSILLEHGTLRISPRDLELKPPRSIDGFLQSLAADRPGRAIGVILSGTGTDGTLGLAAIKSAGGVTFAQDESAEHGGMPQSAIHGGHVDFVLRPAEIAKELDKIARFGFPIPPTPVPADAEEPPADDDAPPPPHDASAYAGIIEQLRAATRIDFTHYRETTILRRTHRRMAMTGTETLAGYQDLLAADPAELAELAKDIVINVTSFFRDKAAFQALATTVFPLLMADRTVGSSIRIWVVGCSTGQEVYSLAIELMEFLTSAAERPQIQIFATDISDWALAKARFGWYPDAIADEIPKARLERYFTRESPGYRIVKAVRDCCVFAKHDITADTPFSRIDLITCRNVLIYLGPELQRRILPTFHFSLKSKGFLMLGTSESTGRSSGLFRAVDERLRIYQSVETASRLAPSLFPHQRAGTLVMSPPPPQFTPTVSELQRVADHMLLGRFAPAGVLVSETMEILQFRGRTNPYLEPAPGEAQLNLLTMVPFGVAEVVRGALAEAKEHNRPVRRERVPLRRDQTFREIVLEVIPITVPTSTAKCFLVPFEEQVAAPAGATASTQPARHAAATDAAPTRDSEAESELRAEILHLRDEAQQLHRELASATDYVHAILQQNQVLAEELKASQEESQSSTEEFRSTNEELQTAKEEVESANEELVTINDELRATNVELSETTRALKASSELTSAIVETMRYPLLVLDPELKVKSVNQEFLDAFKVRREESVGRLVYELGDGQWDIPELRRLLENILPDNSAFDDFQVTHEFRSIGTRTMLLNARRLKGETDQHRLIVLVIADITEQSRNTQNLKSMSQELLRSNDELDQFAAVASHDLQEPLRTISSYMTLLQKQYGPRLDDRAHEFMDTITNGALRMSGMVKGILAYSRLGHEAADTTAFDSAIAVTAARANLAIKIQEAEAAIVERTLPRVTANQEQMTQVFQNLLSNALKFRSADRPPMITIAASDAGTEWVFSIADNGIGMEPTDIGKIFQLFQRLHDRSIPGTGIGLATCKKIIEHHRGRIWAESTPRVGSTFFFSLPK